MISSLVITPVLLKFISDKYQFQYLRELWSSIASTSFSWRRRSYWRTFDPQGSYAERGCPMTTGAQEVTTVDELQLCFVGGGGVVGGPLTLRGRTLRGDAR